MMEDKDRHELEDVNLQLAPVDDKDATRDSHEAGDASTAESSPMPPAGFAPGDEMSEVSTWRRVSRAACTVNGLEGECPVTGTAVDHSSIVDRELNRVTPHE